MPPDTCLCKPLSRNIRIRSTNAVRPRAHYCDRKEHSDVRVHEVKTARGPIEPLLFFWCVSETVFCFGPPSCLDFFSFVPLLPLREDTRGFRVAGCGWLDAAAVRLMRQACLIRCPLSRSTVLLLLHIMVDLKGGGGVFNLILFVCLSVVGRCVRVWVGAGQADSALLPSSCCLLRWCENEARGCLTVVCVGVCGQ